MRTLSDALRAQTHEHANRLHTMVSLLELGRTQEALDFATKDLELSQRLTDDVVGSIDEPVLGALIMGKAAEAHERGVELDARGVRVHGRYRGPGRTGPCHDPGQPAGQRHRRRRRRPGAQAGGADASDTTGGCLEHHGGGFSGPGIDPAAVDDVFRHGFSTKAAGPVRRGLGLALVRQAVQRLGGTMTISQPGGALFHVELPAAIAPDTPSAGTLPADAFPSSTFPSSTFPSSTATSSLPEEHT